MAEDYGVAWTGFNAGEGIVLFFEGIVFLFCAHCYLLSILGSIGPILRLKLPPFRCLTSIFSNHQFVL